MIIVGSIGLAIVATVMAVTNPDVYRTDEEKKEIKEILNEKEACPCPSRSTTRSATATTWVPSWRNYRDMWMIFILRNNRITGGTLQ